MRVLAVVPAIYGNSGDSVNERQFLFSLASKVDKCYVVTFRPPMEFFKKAPDINQPINMILLSFPSVPLIVFTTLFYMAFSYICCFFLRIFNIFLKIDAIYVRSSTLSVGFLSSSFDRHTIVKIPSITEDEIKCGNFTYSILTRINALTDRLALQKSKKVAVAGIPLYNALIQRRCCAHNEKPLILTPGVDFHSIEKINKGAIDKTSKTINIGFIGLISWWQGVETLVQAFAMVNKEFSNLHLVLIGDGASEYAHKVEMFCEKKGISLEISGSIPHEEALKRLKTLNVMVLPSKKTPATNSIIPIKVIEAWALGIPVIVTKHSIFIENNIRDMNDVVYCEPSPDSVARALLALLNDEALMKKLSENGPKIAKMFDYDKIVQRFIGAYDR